MKTFHQGWLFQSSKDILQCLHLAYLSILKVCSESKEKALDVLLIVSGPAIPKDETHRQLSSLIDVSRFILQSIGCSTAGFGAYDLLDDSAASVILEYYAVGSRIRGIMLGIVYLGYICYLDCKPQLFDLENDPEELLDSAYDTAFSDRI